MCCGRPKKQLLETSGAPYPLEPVLPYWKKRSLETWEVKDLEMRTLSWIIWVGSQCSPVYPYKRDREKVTGRWTREGREGASFEGWRDVSTSPGMPATTRDGKGLRTDCSLEAREARWSC